jgi:hypothetical protein
MADAFTYKLVSENEVFNFDFSPALASGETLSTAVCTVTVQDGIDTNPSAILSGTAYISGPKASQRIYNGISETTYRLTMTVTTSLGNTFAAVGDLPVYDNSLV